MFVTAVLLIPLHLSAQEKLRFFRVRTSLQTLAQTAKASASSGAIVGDYGSHAIKLSVQSASGGVEVHAHYDDVFRGD